MADRFTENYEWIETPLPLGEGSFGVVYKGQRKECSDNLVAIKCCKPHFRSAAKHELTRRRSEYELLQRFPHENVVKVIAIEEELTPGKSGQVLIMEFCNERSLLHKVRDNRNGFTEEEFLSVLNHTTAAVKHLSFHNIIHRDIKPGNIMVHVQDGQNIYKLADFGTARIFENETEFSTYCGTIYYMHPYIYGRFKCGQKVAVGEHADLWSLGVTFYQLATGSLPFEFKSPASMFNVTTTKEHGVIAATGSSKRPVALKTLPETCQLSPSLQEKVKYLLARLMETREEDRFSHDEYFAFVGEILSDH